MEVLGQGQQWAPLDLLTLLPVRLQELPPYGRVRERAQEQQRLTFAPPPVGTGYRLTDAPSGTGPRRAERSLGSSVGSSPDV